MTDPLHQPAADLAEIMRLADHLEEHAQQTLRGQIPGGQAMVALAPVASPEAWLWRIDYCETHDLDSRHAGDSDPDWEPPLQTLLFWSEQWRADAGALGDLRPTLISEAGWMRNNLTELHAAHCLEWPDFTADIATARRRLEDILHDGEREDRGVPCMYDECGGARLTRALIPIGDNGQTRWEHTDWRCPHCRRTWDDDAYARHVTAAHERTKFEDIDGETWCTIDYAARTLGRPYRTVQTWANIGKVRRLCIISGRRQFVSLEDAREQDAETGRRVRMPTAVRLATA